VPVSNADANRIPVVRMISPLDVWLAAEVTSPWMDEVDRVGNRRSSDALRWLLLPGAHTALRDQPRPQKPVELLVGPEGGLTDAEVDAAQRAGYQPVRLGPRVLRTETAAPALSRHSRYSGEISDLQARGWTACHRHQHDVQEYRECQTITQHAHTRRVLPYFSAMLPSTM